jgi:hypothetical protein
VLVPIGFVECNVLDVIDRNDEMSTAPRFEGDPRSDRDPVTDVMGLGPSR